MVCGTLRLLTMQRNDSLLSNPRAQQRAHTRHPSTPRAARRRGLALASLWRMTGASRKRPRAAAASTKRRAEPAQSPSPRAAGDEPRVCRTAATSLGLLTLCATPRGVCSLTFSSGAGGADKSKAPASPLEAQAEAWRAQAVAYVDAPARPQASLSFPVDVADAGTPFQRRVWQLLAALPFGETTTYGALAAALRSSPRAVGQAVGRNPVGVRVPCHRVVAHGGKLGGFAWGTDAKRALLRREGVTPPPP